MGTALTKTFTHSTDIKNIQKQLSKVQAKHLSHFILSSLHYNMLYSHETTFQFKQDILSMFINTLWRNHKKIKPYKQKAVIVSLLFLAHKIYHLHDDNPFTESTLSLLRDYLAYLADELVFTEYDVVIRIMSNIFSEKPLSETYMSMIMHPSIVCSMDIFISMCMLNKRYEILHYAMHNMQNRLEKLCQNAGITSEANRVLIKNTNPPHIVSINPTDKE